MKSNTKICILLWLVIAIWSLAICVRGEDPPTPPHWFPTPDSAEGIELQRQIDELETYAASLRPSPRVLMADGQIITRSNEAIEWYVAAPLFEVQWRGSLTEGVWETVGFRSGVKMTHRKPEGFYRVIKIARPSLPPAHPPKRHPNPPPARAAANTNTNHNHGGF